MYIGRFAPSPTGSLHLGSLLAAMASYCDAIKHTGQWLVRIEDLDPPREIPGASHKIIKTLDNLGFVFNNKIVFQSQRHQHYDAAIKKLEATSSIYYCTCSRTELKNQNIHNHTCRNIHKKSQQNLPHSIKIRVPIKNITFNDKIQGLYSKNLLEDCGDFVIKRKDELYSYQLAVVVDDHYQNITHIVRGIDLINSTPWQIYLNSLLNFKQPSYSHIPILVNSQEQKLSKQTFAEEIDKYEPLDVLIKAYRFLNQEPYAQKPKTINEFWNHAINHWDINKIAKVKSIKV